MYNNNNNDIIVHARVAVKSVPPKVVWEDQLILMLKVVHQINLHQKFSTVKISQDVEQV